MAARAGVPQVVIPHLYDQYYWAHRVRKLGIGETGPRAARLTTRGLVAALHRCLERDIAERARAIAAQRLIAAFG